MRALVWLVALACLACASAGGGPLGMSIGGNCEDSCRAAYDRCTDDSRREPDDGTCAGDLQACLARCANTGGRQKQQQVVYGTSGRGIPLSLIPWIISLFK